MEENAPRSKRRVRDPFRVERVFSIDQQNSLVRGDGGVHRWRQLFRVGQGPARASEKEDSPWQPVSV